jgi:hypothetical protein
MAGRAFRVLRPPGSHRRGARPRATDNATNNAGAFVIVLHHPRRRRWIELVGSPYVDSVVERLSPPPWVVVRLAEHVNADQAQEIAEAFMARLDGEPVTVEYKRF